MYFVDKSQEYDYLIDEKVKKLKELDKEPINNTEQYSIDNPNNIFFTTSSLRDYHYTKQKNNAYYHIQAINLPFQNIELFYVDCKEVLK